MSALATLVAVAYRAQGMGKMIVSTRWVSTLSYADGTDKPAQRHNMHFLLAHQSLGPDEFNASANTPSLNLKAIHVHTVSKGVLIYAIARGEPTAADRARVEAFATEVRRSAAASP